MANLPRGDNAILDLQKLEDYCLSPVHPRGRHKAKLFRELLGITRTDAQWLREVLLSGVRTSKAVELTADVFGRRWRIDVPVSRHGREVMIRTIWIIRSNEEIPRFVTCWVM